MEVRVGDLNASLEKLKIDHPTIQRHSVQQIFGHVKQSRDGPESTKNHEAMMHCLTHAAVEVVDQAVSELCALVQSDTCSVETGECFFC